MTNPISEEPLIIPKGKAVQMNQDVIEQPEATSSTVAITSTTSLTSKKRKGSKKSMAGLAMLTTALRSVSTAASGRKKGGVATATLANLEQYRKRLDDSPSSSTAPKQGKSGQLKVALCFSSENGSSTQYNSMNLSIQQVDELKVEVESAEIVASPSNQENPMLEEEDAFTVLPRRSGRLLKVPAPTTDSSPIGN